MKNLNLSRNFNIKDFSPISNLVQLEDLNLYNTKISDISFFEKTKNIKRLNLKHTLIKDFSPISYLNKLVYLDVEYTQITDISFLETNENLKEINITGCKVKKYKFKRKIKIWNF